MFTDTQNQIIVHGHLLYSYLYNVRIPDESASCGLGRTFSCVCKTSVIVTEAFLL